MDKIKELYTRLNTTSLPVAYRAFPIEEAPQLPFICFEEMNSANFNADNRIYYQVDTFEVALYVANKNTALEELVEAALEGIIWRKNENFLEYEKVYEITYTFDF